VCKALVRAPRSSSSTSHLRAAPRTVQWLFGKVREFAVAGGIALFISHRLEEIEALSDRVTVLSRWSRRGQRRDRRDPETRLSS